MSAITVRNLSKRFVRRRGVPVDSIMGPAHWLIQMVLRAGSEPTRVVALENVSFDVRKGEFFGLLGPNGSGKTTLMKCLATLLVPDSGTALVNGYDVLKFPYYVRLSVAMVGSGQWVAFDWSLTVEENLQFFADLYGLPRRLAKARIDEAISAVHLQDRIGQTPRSLSAGERQRLVLAKAFLLRTPLLFLDEPTAHLDPVGTEDILDYIRDDLKNLANTTILFTTHRMEEAEELCDRVAIIDKGRLLALDTPKALVQLVAGFAHLEADIAGVSEDLVAKMAVVPGIRVVDQIHWHGDEAGTTLRLQCEDPDEASRLLVRLSEQLGLSVLSIRPSTGRLADVFMALTGRGLHLA
jgi:ABC-2 type transport system ATP-binding protein